jgi:N-acetyl-gamma-glutamyl-phosphate reductase
MFRCNRQETEYASRVVTTKNAKVGVVGASGYTGEELVRLLFVYPHVDLVAATSRQFSGKTLA